MYRLRGSTNQREPVRLNRVPTRFLQRPSTVPEPTGKPSATVTPLRGWRMCLDLCRRWLDGAVAPGAIAHARDTTIPHWLRGRMVYRIQRPAADFILAIGDLFHPNPNTAVHELVAIAHRLLGLAPAGGPHQQ